MRLKEHCLILLFSNLRLSRYKQFKDFQRRILVGTNLFGRGMDIERVNIVINYDIPEDSDTYLHRVTLVSNRSLEREDSAPKVWLSRSFPIATTPKS